MLNIDLRNKRAFIAGVADDGGFGFAIAKALAEAGASVSVGTWPPALRIFQQLLERGKMADSLALRRGGRLEFSAVIPLDAEYDALEDAPAELRESKRYREVGDFSIAGAAEALRAHLGGAPLDVLVHSLANGPEVKRPLLETSRRGVYGGAVGYFSANGSMDTCIALRTAVLKDGVMYVQAGGGVVADSDPEAEYQESCNKARALIRAAEEAVKFARAAQ